jgi:uncharacterized membrane protein
MDVNTGSNSRKFRLVLKRELQDWLSTGLVESDQAQRITERYALGDLDRPVSSLLAPALYLIGALLIVAGAVSYLSVHWNALPVVVRLCFLILMMGAFWGWGYHQWKVRRTHVHRGHAIFFVGTMIYGASIFLIADMYGLQSSWYNGFGMWAAGALLLAWFTGSVPHVLLMCFVSLIWFEGLVDANPHILPWYPFAVLAAGIPFLRKQVAVATGGILLTMLIGVIGYAGANSDIPWVVFLAVLGACTFSFGYGLYVIRHESLSTLSTPARLFPMLVLLNIAFILGFHDAAGGMDQWKAAGWLWTLPVGLVWLASVEIWRRSCGLIGQGDSLVSRQARMTTGVIVCLTIGILITNGTVATILANIAVILFGVELIWQAVIFRHRRKFWYGALLLLLQIICRFLEYDAHLTVISAVFTSCGLLLMFGGLRFEKYLKAHGTE